MTDLGLILTVIVVIVGLAFRLLLLGTGAARIGFLPEKWQRWFLGDPANRRQRK